MIKLRVLKKYNDVKLNRKIQAGTILEVSNKRGLELLESAKHNRALGFAVLRIDKFSGK